MISSTWKARQAAAQIAHFVAAFKRALKTRPDGFTMDSLGNVRDYDKGFAVASHSYASPEDIARNNPNVLASGDVSSLHFGAWKDKATGATIIDAVEIIGDRDRAFDVAWERGQTAIYDFANKRELRLADFVRQHIRYPIRFTHWIERADVYRD